MKKLNSFIIFCILSFAFLYADTATAEDMGIVSIVSGTGSSYCNVYDSNGNYVSGYVTNYPFNLLPGAYTFSINGSSKKATIVAGKNEISVGVISIIGSGNNSEYCRVYNTDEQFLYERQIIYSFDLFPGDYILSINGTVKSVTIQAGKNEIATGIVNLVSGTGYQDVYLYDADGIKKLSRPAYTNQSFDLFPGTYTLFVNGSSQKITVQTGKNEFPIGIISMGSDTAGEHVYVYNADGITQLSQPGDTNKSFDLFAGDYTFFVNGSSQKVTIKSGKNEIPLGIVSLCSDTTSEYVYLYDADGIKQLSQPGFTNTSFDLFPGTYTFFVNGSSQKATVKSGRNEFPIGIIKLCSDTTSQYIYVYDADGIEKLSQPAYTNKSFDLFAGTYTFFVNGSSQKVTVQAGKNEFPIGIISMLSDTASQNVYVYDEEGVQKLSSPANTNQSFDLFAGTYTFLVNGSSQKITIKSGKNEIPIGIVRLSGADNSTCKVYDANKKYLSQFNTTYSYDIFPGTYIFSINASEQSVTVKAGKNEIKWGEIGSLTVTITPQDAITSGAQWKIVGIDTWYNSGESIELSAGTYTIEFKTISKWTKPENQSVTITNGNVSKASGVYTPQKGSLMEIISPQDAIDAGARWIVSGIDVWHGSNEIASLTPGTYTIEFKAISGWTKPANQTVSIASGETKTLTGVYTRIKGWLQVTINPADAITAGAQWCVSSSCYNSGAKAELAAGTYTLEFKTVSGYTKPINQSVTVLSGETKTLTGTYTPITNQKGWLQVTISPQDAITAGAQWCVSSSCYNSGAKAELSEGTYTLEFKTVSGWTKPANQSVIITGGQTQNATGVYSKIPTGDSFVSRNLSCYIAGNKFTVSLKASPASATSSYAVQDSPPSGWTVSNINNGGIYDSVNNQVKFGLFTDNTARTLTYDVAAPSGETGDKSFSGTASADGLNSAISGDSVISVCADNHPADTDNNFAISISEITAYGSAWKKGTSWSAPPNPIPIDYLTRAGAIWKGGEKYNYDANAGNCPLCWINTTARSAEIRQADSTAVSDMPANYKPGESFTVSIIVTPASAVFVYAVEDFVPSGWSVSSVSDSGSFDAVNKKVKFGPFFDNQPRTLTYKITPPATATGAYSFIGTASFDGVNIEISGKRSVSVGGTAEIIPGDANQDGKLDMQDVVYILRVLTEIK